MINELIHLRMEPALVRAIEKAAAENGRSTQKEVRARLREIFLPAGEQVPLFLSMPYWAFSALEKKAEEDDRPLAAYCAFVLKKDVR